VNMTLRPKTVDLGEIIAPATVDRVGDNNMPILSMTMHDGLVDQSSKFKKRVASNDLSTYRAVRRGQLVVGFPIDEGVLSFQNLYEMAAVSPAYGVWDLRRSGSVDCTYLERFLRSPTALAYYAAKLRSTTARRRSLDRGTFLALPVPLPPLAEQRRIAAILDQADALRRLRRRALDHLNTLGQAIFHEMFVARPSDWPSVKIDEVISNARTGPFGSQLLHSEFVDSGIPVLGIDNVVSNEFVWAEPRFITAEKYRELKRYTVTPGDVLITIMGTCGRCAIVPDDMPTAINTKHICCLTPDRSCITSQYLRAAFLMHPLVLRQLGVEAKGAVMPGLNMGIIKKTEIPLPPLDLQLRFGERMGRILRQDRDTRRQATSLDSLFASLQHRAFTGQL